MEERKRKRCPNFSEYEAEVVAVLALKYQAIIDSKRTDGETLKKKEAVWSRIEEEFNEIEGVSHRSSKHLKTHYENLKRRHRRSCAAVEKSDGSSVKPELSKTSEKIVSLIQTIRPNSSTQKVDPPLQEEETNLQVEAEVEVSCTNDVTDTSDVTRTSPSLSPIVSMVSQHLTSARNADADTETSVPSSATDLKAVETVVSSMPSASSITEREIIKFPKKISPKDKIKCLSTTVLKPVSPKIMPCKNEIIDFCERRKDILKMQAEMLQREHDMDMIIKDLKIKILKEKFKYWQRLNCSTEEE